MTASATNYLQIGQKLVAAMNAGDMETILAQMHPSVEVIEAESVPHAGTWRGRDGFIALFEQLFKIADLSIASVKIHEIDNGIVMEMTVNFTSHKDGEVLRMPLIEVDRFEGDLVRKIEVYYQDTAALNDFAARQV